MTLKGPPEGNDLRETNGAGYILHVIASTFEAAPRFIKAGSLDVPSRRNFEASLKNATKMTRAGACS